MRNNISPFRKRLQSALRVLDWIAIRVLLLALGISLAELGVRLAGYTPRSSVIHQSSTRGIVQEDSELGWRLAAHDGGFGTGEREHSETVFEDGSRLVTPVPADPLADSIVVIGDSSVFGWALNDEETFASALARRFPSYRVVNAAVPGFGVLQSMLWMKRIAPKYKPSYIILGYTEYLMPRDLGGLTWASLVATAAGRGNISFPYARLVQGQLQIVPPKPYFVELPGRQYLGLITVFEDLLALHKGGYSEAEGVRISNLIFQSWADWVREQKAAPVVFFWNKDRSEQLFGNFLRGQGIATLDCTHPKHGTDEAKIDREGHPSAMVVDYWAECILRSGIITKKSS